MRKARPEHLPIGLDLTRFSETRIDAERTEYRRRAGISRDDFVVLFVGNYTAAKGIHELVSVLSSLSDQGVVGLFVGTGPLAREIRAIPRAIDMGRQPNSEIPAILKLADVLVLPSHREGLPTVVVEAGATGLPVVATRVGGIPELLSPDRGYLVEPMDVRQLQAAITQVMRSPGDSSARAKRLNEHVRKHYDAIGNARRLLSVYGHPRLNRTNPDALDS